MVCSQTVGQHVETIFVHQEEVLLKRKSTKFLDEKEKGRLTDGVSFQRIILLL